MIRFLKKIFKNEKDDLTVSEVKGLDISTYFQQEIDSSELIKPGSKKRVLDHLTHKSSLTKTGNNLSTKEKLALGINTKLSITQELVSVLNKRGIEHPDPTKILPNLFHRARYNKTRDEALAKYAELGIEKIILIDCKDERDCDWCKSQDGVELAITENINKLIQENCQCKSRCRLKIQAVANFEN